jgi:nicotinamidase-related amidase
VNGDLTPPGEANHAGRHSHPRKDVVIARRSHAHFDRFPIANGFATKSIDPVMLRNNAALVANAAKAFNVTAIPTTVAEISGPMFDEIKSAFPKARYFDRTTMNTWEDAAVIKEVNRIGKGRIVLCGLWTSVCIVGPALSARSRLRGLCGRRCLWRRFQGGARARD